MHYIYYDCYCGKRLIETILLSKQTEGNFNNNNIQNGQCLCLNNVTVFVQTLNDLILHQSNTKRNKRNNSMFRNPLFKLILGLYCTYGKA